MKRKEKKRVVELGANWIQASIVISQGSMCKARASHGKKSSDQDQFQILFISQNKDINNLIFKIHRDLH